MSAILKNLFNPLKQIDSINFKKEIIFISLYDCPGKSKSEDLHIYRVEFIRYYFL